MYNLAELDFYYLPTNFTSKATLDAITVKDRYVCVYYYIKDLSFINFSSTDDEEIARISNTIKLEWIRNVIGEELLNNTIEQFSLKEFSNAIYYYDITYPTEPETVLSKSFYWVYEGFMFNLDIPIDLYTSFDSNEHISSLIKEIEKVYIT